MGARHGASSFRYTHISVALRQANWWIQSETYGRITVGRTNDAVNGINNINLASPDGFSGLTGPGYAAQGFFMRRAGAGNTGNTALSGFTWRDAAFMRNGSGPASFNYSETGSQVKYTSPFFLGQSKSSGFRLDATWGMDDFWSVGLRYAETWGAFRIAAGAGYENWTGADRGQCSLGSVGNATNAASGGSNPTLAGVPGTAISNAGSNTKCDGILGSVSLMHVPTGLYVSAGGGQIEDKNSQAAFNQASGIATGTVNRPGNDGKSSAWYAQLGWQARLNALGNTTFWGQTVQYSNGLGVANTIVQNLPATDVLNSLGNTAIIGGSTTKIWGGGVSQEINAAAMTLYAGFHNYSTEISLINQSTTATVQRAKSNAVNDMQLFYTGATIKF